MENVLLFLDIVDSPHLLCTILLALNFIVQLSVAYPRISADLEQIVQAAMISLKKDIKLLEEDIKNIQCLGDEDHLTLFFSQFTSLNLSTLTDSELRFIIALFIESVSVTDSGSYSIHFKNQPFDLD